MASRQRWKSRLFASRQVRTGGSLFLLIVVASAAAKLIAPADPNSFDFMARFAPPSLEHLFGTDHFGRDILSRVLLGSRVSLLIGTIVVLATGILGTLVGAVSGYLPRLDNVLMRLMDALMAFPTILFALAISTILGPSVVNVAIALTVAYTPRTARIVRSSVIALREREFVEAASALGAQTPRVLIRHVLPNSLGPLIVQLTFIFAYAVLAEAALSFLGMGPPPPAPTWGNIISEGRNYLREAPWITFFAGTAIALTVLSLNLVGDGLRDIFDPRSRVAGHD